MRAYFKNSISDFCIETVSLGQMERLISWDTLVKSSFVAPSVLGMDDIGETKTHKFFIFTVFIA